MSVMGECLATFVLGYLNLLYQQDQVHKKL